VLKAFYILTGIQVALGTLSLLSGIAWLRFVRRRMWAQPAPYAPRVALICPCKGLEPGLEENLAALTQFDYPDFELFFVIADRQDAARAVIDRLVKSATRPVHLIVAGVPQDCGEKMNNLRAAVEAVGNDFEVLVFADSDGRPGAQWLRRLVAPLADAHLGAATTFRWYLPFGRGRRANLASAFLSAWNAAIVTMLGEHARNFCWGGGTAIRRQVFDETRVVDFWKGAVSDDYAMTRALQSANRQIVFVPECLTATFHDATARSLLEFTNRQMVITRIYSPRMWKLAALSHLLYSATLVYAAGIVIWSAEEERSWRALTLVTMVIPLLAAAKGMLRAVAAAELLPDKAKQVRQWRWAWILLAPLVSFLYAWNTVVAACTRRIRWRGIEYELVSPGETKIISQG
jgi:ceramide glucosyltransferase